MMAEIDECNAELARLDATLVQVHSGLEAALFGEEDTTELEQLAGDLMELRTLTQDKLLNLCKAQLLAQLNPIEVSDDDSNGGDDIIQNRSGAGEHTEELSDDADDKQEVLSVKSSNSTDISQSSDDSDCEQSVSRLNIDLNQELEGTLCSVPYWSANGVFFYHNAVINSFDDERQCVWLVLCNPTRTEEMTCTRWLEGDTSNCFFGETKACQLSHGFRYPVTRLRHYQSPDFSVLEEERQRACLCRLDNEQVWRHSLVHHVDFVQQICYVQLRISSDSSSNTATDTCYSKRPIGVPLDRTFPLPRRYSSKTDMSGGSKSRAAEEIEDKGDSSVAEDMGETFRMSLESSDGKAFAEWEQHTRGFGSRIMASMGFVPGQGLGRTGNGRTIPVPIEMIPPGRSLDKVMQLRERRKNKQLGIDNCASKGAAGSNKNSTTQSSSVFSFLNRHVSAPTSSQSGHRHSGRPNAKQKSRPSAAGSHISEKQLAERSDKSISVQIYETSKEIERVEADILKQRAGLSRTGASGKVRLSELESYLAQLRSSEKVLTRHQTQRRDKKKLSVF